MAPKPDQMQLEKQKNAEIQRTQQAAEQNQNMQQPVQQNEQTRQNAQQFWTEEMALQELIPMQSENLSQEMKNAYENAHGQRMGVKTRIWRTERTTKKKREKSNALRAADARYAHNRQILEEKYAIRDKLADRNEQYQESVKSWLDVTGSEKSIAYNNDLVNNIVGNRRQHKKAIFQMFKTMEKWNLDDYKNLNDQTISERYYDLKDKIEKAKALRYLLKDAAGIGIASSVEYQAKINARCEFFIRLEPYIQAKYELITSPYYSLLRKADLDALSDEQLKQQEQAGGNTQSFYRSVYMLRKMREDARALMAEPSDAVERMTQELLPETREQKRQAEENDRRLSQEEREREAKQQELEVEQYERDRKERQAQERKEKPERARVLDERRKLSELAREAVRKETDIFNRIIAIFDSLSANVQMKLKDPRDLKAMIEPEMTDEQMRQRFENFASDDPQVRHAEYEKVFERMMNQDLSQFRIATDEDFLYHAAENLRLLDGFIQMKLFMERALKDKMEISTERREEILKKYRFFCMLSRWYEGHLSTMAETEYGETLPEELPKELPESEEEQDKVISVRKKEFLDKNQPERARRWETLLRTYFKEMDVATNTEARQFDRTKTVQELWENYKTEEELVAQEKAERKR